MRFNARKSCDMMSVNCRQQANVYQPSRSVIPLCQRIAKGPERQIDQRGKLSNTAESIFLWTECSVLFMRQFIFHLRANPIPGFHLEKMGVNPKGNPSRVATVKVQNRQCVYRFVTCSHRCHDGSSTSASSFLFATSFVLCHLAV